MSGVDGNLEQAGATVVISHTVGSGKQVAYECWLAAAVALSKTSPGHLDWHIVRPIPGRTQTYTIIMRFDTPDNLGLWMQSTDRERVVALAAPLLVKQHLAIKSGLDFWFAASGAAAPQRWKQYLVTWSAIFPLVLLTSLFLRAFVAKFELAVNVAAFTLVLTAIVVFLMVYLVMPWYSRLLHRWLYK